MTSLADILQRLHGLAAEDRTWILGRLPAPAKSTLLAAASGEPSRPLAAACGFEAPALPHTLTPQSVAAALKDEPAWLVAAVLEGTAESWAAAVIAHLPAVMRSDIATMRHAGSRLPLHARQTLIRLFLAKVGQAEPPPVPSRFHTLFERLSASRSRKRLMLHL